LLYPWNLALEKIKIMDRFAQIKVRKQGRKIIVSSMKI